MPRFQTTPILHLFRLSNPAGEHGSIDQTPTTPPNATPSHASSKILNGPKVCGYQALNLALPAATGRHKKNPRHKLLTLIYTTRMPCSFHPPVFFLLSLVFSALPSTNLTFVPPFLSSFQTQQQYKRTPEAHTSTTPTTKRAQKTQRLDPKKHSSWRREHERPRKICKIDGSGPGGVPLLDPLAYVLG